MKLLLPLLLAAPAASASQADEYLVAKHTLFVQMAKESVEFTAKAHDRMEALHKAARAGEMEVEECRQELQRAKTEVALRELDLEEVRVTGLEPNDDLTAPLVGETDFVSKRLVLLADLAFKDAEVSQSRKARTEILVEQGLADAMEQTEAIEEYHVVRTEWRALEVRRELREQFLAGKMDAERVEGLWHQFELETALEHAQRRLEFTKQRLDRARALEGAGRESDALSYEHELNMLRLEIALIELELDR